MKQLASNHSASSHSDWKSFIKELPMAANDVAKAIKSGSICSIDFSQNKSNLDFIEQLEEVSCDKLNAPPLQNFSHKILKPK